MARLQSEMNRLMGGWGANAESWPVTAVAYPPVNMWEDDDHVYAEAEMPGLKLEDLSIEIVGGNQLSIKGERTPARPENVEWHRQERGFGRFERGIVVPVAVDPTKVEARLENGVLTVTMAKSAAAKPRKIPVKAV
jgi:HSP20 family protein